MRETSPLVPPLAFEYPVPKVALELISRRGKSDSIVGLGLLCMGPPKLHKTLQGQEVVLLTMVKAPD